MLSRKAETTKEESRDRKTQENSEDIEMSTTESADKENEFSPALLTGIMVSVGIGLFTICAVLYWICKVQLAEGKKMEDKCVLFEDENTEYKSENAKNNTMVDSENVTKEIEENPTSEPTGTPDSEFVEDSIEKRSMTEKNCPEVSESIKQEASIDLPEDEQCENKDEHSSSKPHFEDSAASVIFGPLFVGNMTISSAANNTGVNTKTDHALTGPLEENCQSSDKENEILDTNCNKVLLQPSDYHRSISINDMSGNFQIDSAVSEACSTSVSPSLQHLAKMNEPTRTSEDEVLFQDDDSFMFPWDNSNAMNKEIKYNQEDDEIKDNSGRTPEKDLHLSRSLDSAQQKSLEKGCQLLKTRPRRSSLKLSGSADDCKKYVHFPEDIRHIRKVYKYDSFDETILLHNSEDKNVE